MFTLKQFILGILSTILTGILIFLVVPYLVTTKSWGWSYSEKTGVIGDTIGGITGPIIAFAGIILTFLAFYIQYQANLTQIKALEDQKKESQKNDRQTNILQIENTFFQLMNIHRENVREMDFRGIKGRNAIEQILREFYEILEYINKNGFIRENRLDEQDLANIAYLILFFGVDETVQDTLENRFAQHYSSLTGEILLLVEKLRGKTNSTSVYANKYYYGGHQSRLGHYYRHLFRTVFFIHESEILNQSEKEKYIAILRTQLSTHEQVLLFFNSISDLGLRWELRKDVLPKNHLISKYNLIRNVPLGFMYGYNPKRYYPRLSLENDFELTY